MKTVISPSILSADFADMGNAVRRLEQCGAGLGALRRYGRSICA